MGDPGGCAIPSENDRVLLLDDLGGAAYLRDHGRRSIEPSLEKQDEWVAHHDEVTQGTLVVKTDSWYTGANIDGKPSKRLLSYLGAGAYKQACDELKESGYAGFVLD